jgi:GNAT superfamily N-acetyltransferase
MSNCTIRNLKISDMEKMGELLRTRETLDQESAEKRKQLLEWLAFNNPFANGLPTYFIAEDEGKIVAHLGSMPIEVVIEGRCHKSCYIQDLYVHPDYIKKGQGFFLSMALYSAVEKSIDTFVCGLWATPLNLKMLRQRGYLELKADKYVKILDPRKLLDPRRKLKIPQVKFLLRVLGSSLRVVFDWVDCLLLRINSREVSIREVGRFDSRFDDLNQKILSKIGISTYKDSKYLNWKYIDRPLNKKRVFAAEKDGQISGFVVLSSRPQGKYLKATILDLMADPDDTKIIAALCRKTIQVFREQKAYSINCYLTDKRFAKVFKRFLFLKDPCPDSFLLTNLDKCQVEREKLLDINNWHLSYGESDGSMLNPY